MTLLLQHHLGALYGLDLLEADYFRRAMKIFTQDFSHVIFVVVTDDMAWAEENLKIPGVQVCHVQKKPTLMIRVVLCLPGRISGTPPSARSGHPPPLGHR